jgi:hypothetical protein
MIRLDDAMKQNQFIEHFNKNSIRVVKSVQMKWMINFKNAHLGLGYMDRNIVCRVTQKGIFRISDSFNSVT